MQMEEQEANEPQNHDLICAICLDIFFRPTTVYPCRHIFCDPCLRRLSNARIVRCPLCRTPIKRCLFNRGKYGQPLWLLQLTFTTYANLISKRQPLYKLKRLILKYYFLFGQHFLVMLRITFAILNWGRSRPFRGRVPSSKFLGFFRKNDEKQKGLTAFFGQFKLIFE